MIVPFQFQDILLLAFAVTGLLISILSLMEPYVTWITRFCRLFGEGCKKTAEFTLLNIPVSMWGTAYYCLLLLTLFLARPAAFWLIMAGFGVELTFVRVMITRHVFCIFCLFNALVVALLFVTVFDLEMLWQASTLILLFFLVSGLVLVRENPAQSAPAPPKKTPAIVAEINGDQITAVELERPLSRRIYSLQSEISELKRKRLEKIIRNRLLQKDAAKKGISVHQLIQEILSEREPVTEEEIERYFLLNPDRLQNWEGTREDLHNELRLFLQKKKNTEKIRRYADSLKKEFNIRIHLEEPSVPSSPIHVGKNPSWGPEDSPVLVVEFSDYLCPACKSAHETTKALREKYKDRIHWVFKDFPLPMHKGARKLAHAARCAGEQGKFWEYQDLLFRSEQKPDRQALLDFAEELYLDRNRFGQCIQNGRYEKLIDNDIKEGHEAGVECTPSYFINGRIVKGAPSLKSFREEIEQELGKSHSPTQKPKKNGQ